MAARAGMGNLIDTLRAWAQAGTAEYSLVGENYFSDDHLQAILDQYRDDVYWYHLTVAPRTDTGGTVVYYDYYFPPGYWEESASGTAAWTVQDSTGAVVDTDDYDVAYTGGHIRFDSDTLGTAYYLSARNFDMNRAAADVWRRKAANVANRFDVSTDNHSLKRSQLMQGCLQMAKMFEGQAPARVIIVGREDAW